MNIPLAYTIGEVCRLANIGRTSVYNEISAGTLRAVKRGRRTLILAEDLHDWIGRLPEFGGASDQTRETAGKARGAS